MLHALHIPLTGLFAGGVAVILISLIAHYSQSKTAILKATILVLIIKFIVSPYTPLLAYLSVFTEGLLGILFFNVLGLKDSAPILLGFFSLLFSSLQKIIILSLVFGMTFWDSIDLFVDFILKQISITSGSELSFSYLIISLYVLIHILVGIFAGVISLKIPNRVENFSHKIEFDKIIIPEFNFPKRGKKKAWYKKVSGVLFLLITISLIVFSYTTNEFNSNLPLRIGIMLVRSIAVTTIWVFLLTPYALKFLHKILGKKKSEYSDDVDNLLKLLPEMAGIIKYCWSASDKERGIKRINLFINFLFAITLRNS